MLKEPSAEGQTRFIPASRTPLHQLPSVNRVTPTFLLMQPHATVKDALICRLLTPGIFMEKQDGKADADELRYYARMKRMRMRAVFLLAILQACCACAFALDPSLDVSQYSHKAWNNREGFPRDLIHAIAQTPDGYLWLGTEFGLLKFDGVHAAPWQPPPDQHLPGDKIQSLLVTSDGTLWIGTWKGLASWKDGKLTQYPELAEKVIFPLMEDRDGVVWAGGFAYSPPGKLCSIQRGVVKCYGEDGSLGNGVLGLYEDRNRNLWAGTLTGLWRWKPGPPKFYPIGGEPAGIQGMAEDESGRNVDRLAWQSRPAR